MSGEAGSAPDGSGAVVVNTVLGVIDATELGMTLTHEHLVCDWTARMDPPQDPEERARWDRPVDASDAWLLTENPAARRDNGLLNDPDIVAEELRNFIEVGGRTVIECSNDDIGRDSLVLQRISTATGLNVIMGSGWYVHAFHDAATLAQDEDELSESLLLEFEHGVRGTGVKPGIIGEIGVSPMFTEAERVRLRAACRAQLRVGVPLLIHMPGWQRRAFEVLDIVLGEEGVSPESVVLCHMDPSGADIGYQRGVAEAGVWLEFDMVGMASYYAGEGQSPSPEQTAIAISGLVDDGFASQLLLSHDVSVKSMWTRNGGNGFGYVPRLFLPRLQRHGVPASVTAALLTSNPSRLFERARRTQRSG
mgnify:CR=1 FL=1